MRLHTLYFEEQTWSQEQPENRRSADFTEVRVPPCQNDPACLEYASEELRGDREIVLEAVKHKDGALALEFASAELCADPEVVLSAVQEGASDITVVLQRDASSSEPRHRM